MGIVRRDYRPKPAYLAFGTLAHLLRGRKLAGAVPLADGTLAYRFKAGAPGCEELLALWNPARDIRVSVPMRPGRVLRINAVGEQLVLEARGGRVEADLKKGAAAYLTPTE
jgi:hypothetical protein